MGGQRHAPAALPSTHCVGGWVGPRAGLDGRGKPYFHRDSIPGPASPLQDVNSLYRERKNEGLAVEV